MPVFFTNKSNNLAEVSLLNNLSECSGAFPEFLKELWAIADNFIHHHKVFLVETYKSQL